MFKRIDEKFYYAPLIKFQFTAGKSIYKTKTPGFNETSSYFKNTSYGVEIQPLIFSYLLKKKFLLQTGLGKIGYGYSKSSTDAPNSDAAGSGNSFAFDFSPFITSIKISLLF